MHITNLPLPTATPATAPIWRIGPRGRLRRVLGRLRRGAEPTIRRRLTLLALSVAVPAALILLIGSLQAWEAGRQRTDRALTERAEALAALIGHELEVSRTTLQVLATSPYLAAGDMDGFAGQIDQVPREEGTRIGLSDPSGQMRLNSSYARGVALPMRGNLGTLRSVVASGQPEVSNLYTGAVAGEPLVSIDVPVFDAAGRIIFDLHAAFRPDVLVRAMARSRLPPSWLASVFDRAGILVARSRQTDRYVGRSAASATLAAFAGEVSPFATTNQEGVAVRGAYATVPWAGWNVLVMVPQAEIDALLWRSLLLAGLGGGILLLVGLLVAAWQANGIARPLATLAAGAAALGRGEVPPAVPAGVREASEAGSVMGRAARDSAGRRQEREEAERRRGLVTAELNHRVKNVLATVQATAAHTLRGSGGDPARFAQDFNARLRALARAHDLLTANDWDGAELEAVVRIALAPWLGTAGAGEAASVGCHCDGAVALRPQQAHALVLALHELATNAAKYGALSRRGGRVSVRCGANGRGGAWLEWVEMGGPPVSGPPARQGFGTRLLQRELARDLGPGATVVLRFDPDGLGASMGFPARAAVEAALAD